MTQCFGTSRAILVASFFLVLSMSLSAGRPRSDIDRVLGDFPGYHLLKLTELNADARAFFQQHFAKANPSVVQADFDGDGKLDYALLLRNEKTHVTKLVVLLCPEERHCRNVYELDLSADSGSAYLRPVPRGSRISQTESIDTEAAPVNLKFSGIRLTYVGQAEVVLYWNKKLRKIDTIQTKD